MSLLSRLRERQAGKIATATLATFATQQEVKGRTVASVATVIVAKSPRGQIALPPTVGAGNTATTSHRWLIHYPDRDPLEVACCPEATHAEILERNAEAVAAEPFTPTIRQPSAPLTVNEEAAIRAWLALIEETDPAIIAEVVGQCQRDADARDYFTGRAVAELPVDDRRTCQQCSNFMAKRCIAQLRNGVNNKNPMFVIPDVPQRYPGYLPRLSDPDRRIGTARWPGLAGKTDSKGKES